MWQQGQQARGANADPGEAALCAQEPLAVQGRWTRGVLFCPKHLTSFRGKFTRCPTIHPLSDGHPHGLLKGNGSHHGAIWPISSSSSNYKHTKKKPLQKPYQPLRPGGPREAPGDADSPHAAVGPTSPYLSHLKVLQLLLPGKNGLQTAHPDVAVPHQHRLPDPADKDAQSGAQVLEKILDKAGVLVVVEH